MASKASRASRNEARDSAIRRWRRSHWPCASRSRACWKGQFVRSAPSASSKRSAAFWSSSARRARVCRSLRCHQRLPRPAVHARVLARCDRCARRLRRCLELDTCHSGAAGEGPACPRLANPLRSLAGDSAYIASVVNEIDGPVILVGHSYGGAVITVAAASAANVVGLVYIAAFILDENESFTEVLSRFPDTPLEQALIRSRVRRACAGCGLEDAAIVGHGRHARPDDPPRRTALHGAACRRAGYRGDRRLPLGCCLAPDRGGRPHRGRGRCRDSRGIERAGTSRPRPVVVAAELEGRWLRGRRLLADPLRTCREPLLF
jgi:hypothetical protein